MAERLSRPEMQPAHRVTLVFQSAEHREAWLRLQGVFDDQDPSEQARKRAAYIARQKSSDLTFMVGRVPGAGDSGMFFLDEESD